MKQKIKVKKIWILKKRKLISKKILRKKKNKISF